MTHAEIRAAHPFPWRYGTSGVVQRGPLGGTTEIKVIDAAGKEVSFAAMLDLLVLVTTVMSRTPANPQPEKSQA